MAEACAGALYAARAEHWMSVRVKAGVDANSISYCRVITACAEALDAASAQHCMYLMLTAGVGASTVSYTW